MRLHKESQKNGRRALWRRLLPALLCMLLLVFATGCGGESAAAEESGEPHAEAEVDVDLTTLSSTMVYAEISNMYFACVNQDATKCCAQGIEFILPEDEYTYPDDYPTEGDEIVVQGTFDTYFEGEYMYPTLRNASLIEQ